MSPYRSSVIHALFHSEPGVNIQELDVVAGQVRHALLTGGFAGQPRSKLARIAINIETDHSRLARKTAEKQGVLAALAGATAACAGVALKLLVGREALAVAATLAALTLIFGVMLAYTRGWDAILTRASKSYDELQRYIATLPDDGATSVRIDVDRLAGESLDAVPSFLEDEAPPARKNTP